MFECFFGVERVLLWSAGRAAKRFNTVQVFGGYSAPGAQNDSFHSRRRP
jgi:hypothetical protein